MAPLARRSPMFQAAAHPSRALVRTTSTSIDERSGRARARDGQAIGLDGVRCVRDHDHLRARRSRRPHGRERPIQVVRLVRRHEDDGGGTGRGLARAGSGPRRSGHSERRRRPRDPAGAPARAGSPCPGR